MSTLGVYPHGGEPPAAATADGPGPLMEDRPYYFASLVIAKRYLQVHDSPRLLRRGVSLLTSICAGWDADEANAVI